MDRIDSASARTAVARRVIGCASLAVLAACLSATGAEAQAAGPESGATVSEVVVTAEKRAERLQSVPASVTSVSGAQLSRIEAVRLSDIQALVPGLELVADREGDTQIIMRGITTGPMTPTATVSTYVDEAPFGSSTGFALGQLLTPDLDPADLQRIEVLRGPQGTLYGASALGGLIKYVTTPPDLANYAGRLEADGSVAEHGGDGYGLRGMINLPLVKDALGLRISAFDRLDPGYVDDPNLGLTHVNSTHVYGGRASLLWQATPQLSVRLSAQLQNLHSDGTNDVDVDGQTLAPLYGDLIQKRNVSEPQDIHYRLYSAVVNWDLGWASLVSATSYATLREKETTDLSDTYSPLLGSILHISDLGVAFITPVDQNKFTQEFRLASPGGHPFEWQAGVFFTHESSTHGEQFDPFLTAGDTPVPINLLSGALISRYTEYAGFGDVTYHVTSKFDVQAGVRYSGNDQHYSQPESGALIGPATTLVATSSDRSATFLVSPRYQIDANQMVYVRIASGYRPGGPNPLTPSEEAAGVPTAYAPDTLINYEVGYKASLLDHRLTLDVDAFFIDWRNIQLQTVFDGFDATGNGGSARSDGFEGALTFIPMRGLTIDANLAYTNAQLTQDAPGVSGKDGDELPDVPRWAGHIGADYDFPIAPFWSGFFGGGVHFIGDRRSGFVSGAPSSFVRPTMPSYTTVEVRAGVVHKGWTVELYVKNAGDVRGISNLSSVALSGVANPYEAAIIQPRTIGLSISAAY
jgi:outer membrane receptor protein involved in Fe transport